MMHELGASIRGAWATLYCRRPQYGRGGISVTLRTVVQARRKARRGRGI